MKPTAKAWRVVKMTFIILIILCVLPFTPLFANLSVWALSLFSNTTLPRTHTTPTSIVLLGGGLTKSTDGEITLNSYSQTRATQAYHLQQSTDLPIITSGVESPWLRDHLIAINKNAVIISENASMNTCENAVFTAKLLRHHELANAVYLVTDRYHMARARRQFALAGIITIPFDAPLLAPLSWHTPRQNLAHSRRAIYEIAALSRDILRPQNNCRTDSQIDIGEISTPRRAPKVFSQTKFSKQ